MLRSGAIRVRGSSIEAWSPEQLDSEAGRRARELAAQSNYEGDVTVSYRAPEWQTPKGLSGTQDFWRDESGGITADLATLGLTKFVSQDVLPTAKLAGLAMSKARDSLLKVFAPAARKGALAPSGRPVAKDVALSVRANAAELARSTDQARAALRIASRYFDRQNPDANLDFMDRVEKGVAQPDPYLDQVAKAMRDILDSRRDEIRDFGTGRLENFIENYFPHIWQDPEKAAEQFANWGKRPLEGSKAFLKKRKIPTIREGVDMGLVPFSTNPVDLVLAKAREMDKYIMAQRVMAEAGTLGVLRFIRATEPLPAGYAKIDDRVGTSFGPRYGAVKLPEEAEEAGVSPRDVKVYGLRIMGYWVMPEPGARILNNYLSPGLRDKSALFRTYLGIANLLNQAQLGWSAFHLGFTTVEAAISRAALGVYQTAKGYPLKGVKSVLTTPFAPFTGIVQGNKMLREWYTPGTQGSEIATLVDAMVQAGGRAKMDAFYVSHVTESMMRALRQGNIVGGLLRLPFALTEQAARPIMEYIVPRQKMGVFADLARFELERLGVEADTEEGREALARAWDSVDNRMGQLVYDNLFWNKVTKDLAMASVRTVGWNLGTIREIAGGTGDWARFAGGKTEFTPRMAYVLAFPVIAGLLGAILYYLWHGKAPETLKDAFFPTDSHGQRWSLPTYMKDVYAWKHSPKQTLRGKLHPLFTLILEMLANENYFGREIYHENDPLVDKAKKLAEHAGEAVEPIAARNVGQAQKKHAGMEERVLPFIGITPSPAWMDHPTRRYRNIRVPVQ